jgi:hypothetical protein
VIAVAVVCVASAANIACFSCPAEEASAVASAVVARAAHAVPRTNGVGDARALDFACFSGITVNAIAEGERTVFGGVAETASATTAGLTVVRWAHRATRRATKSEVALTFASSVNTFIATTIAVARNDGICCRHSRTFGVDAVCAIRTVFVLLRAVDASATDAVGTTSSARRSGEFAGFSAVVETEDTTVAVAFAVSAISVIVADFAVVNRALHCAVGVVGVVVVDAAAITNSTSPVSSDIVGEAFADGFCGVEGINFAQTVSRAWRIARASDIAEIETRSESGRSVTDFARARSSEFVDGDASSGERADSVVVFGSDVGVGTESGAAGTSVISSAIGASRLGEVTRAEARGVTRVSVKAGAMP